MRVRRWLALGAAVVLFGACTRGSTTAHPLAAATGSRAGGTLTVGFGRPGSVDPLDAYEPNGLLIARTMCDTLLEIDPRTGSLRPGLASSWEIQDNGTQFSMRLRKGARFSDGRKVTAADVAFSLSRAANPAFAGRAAELLSPIVGWPELRGETKSSNPRTRKELVGVRALTSDTVRIDLRFPLADAIRLFTHPVTAPVSKRATEADPDRAAAQPTCAGPYRLAQPWTASASTIVLERVRSYDARSTTRTRGGAGYADRIEFLVGEAPADVVVPHPTDATRAGMERVSGPAPGAEFVGLPAGTTSPFRERVVREALSAALDRERLTTVVGADSRAPALGFLPPSLGRTTSCGDRVPLRADVTRAKALLGGAHIELTSQAMQLFFNDDGRNRTLVEDVAAQWRDALGLNVQTVALPFDELVSKATLGAGMPGPFRVSWSAAYPSADAQLAPLFSGGATSQANFGRWSDPQWDRSLNREARKADNEADRRVQYQRLQDRLCQTLPAIPLLWQRAILDVNPARVGGTFLDPVTGAPNPREIWVR
jgi:ABC-type oligopeptide transport system substrate-binding subunit